MNWACSGTKFKLSCLRVIFHLIFWWKLVFLALPKLLSSEPNNVSGSCKLLLSAKTLILKGRTFTINWWVDPRWSSPSVKWRRKNGIRNVLAYVTPVMLSAFFVDLYLLVIEVIKVTIYSNFVPIPTRWTTRRQLPTTKFKEVPSFTWFSPFAEEDSKPVRCRISSTETQLSAIHYRWAWWEKSFSFWEASFLLGFISCKNNRFRWQPVWWKPGCFSHLKFSFAMNHLSWTIYPSLLMEPHWHQSNMPRGIRSWLERLKWWYLTTWTKINLHDLPQLLTFKFCYLVLYLSNFPKDLAVSNVSH